MEQKAVRNLNKIPIITIDGASGTGKGVVTHIIAKKLNWNLLDSGVLYRALALAAQYRNISLEDETTLATLAEQLPLEFVATETGGSHIFLDKQNVTDLIRTEKIGNAASKVAAFPAVRTALLSRQRAFRIFPGLVADGRDMGTVIFPDAMVKIFLTASPEERAARRYNQLNEKGIHVNLSALVEELRERDKRDQERAVAPLKPAMDAVIIDTDPLSIEQVVARIMIEVEKKGIITS
jgi:cytidylate kinase